MESSFPFGFMECFNNIRHFLGFLRTNRSNASKAVLPDFRDINFLRKFFFCKYVFAGFVR